MDTNGNSKVLSALLADARLGTFTGLIVKKVGKEVGKGADKKRYDDDTVHTVIFTGFKYENLVKKSLALLAGIDLADVVAKCLSRGQVITLADAEEAAAELKVSYEKSIAGTNESTTDHVYEPLVVDGVTVRGSRVYKCVAGKADESGKPYECKCHACTGEEKAPKDGTIYLQGLRIFSSIIAPAVNGHAPEPKSAPKTLAKNEITHRLPISKYVSYKLEAGGDWILNAGGTAALQATDRGFVVTDEVMDVLAKAA